MQSNKHSLQPLVATSMHRPANDARAGHATGEATSDNK
jgi:hypothetical protein